MTVDAQSSLVLDRLQRFIESLRDNRLRVTQHESMDAMRALRWFDHYLKGEGDRRMAEKPPLDVDYSASN